MARETVVDGSEEVDLANEGFLWKRVAVSVLFERSISCIGSTMMTFLDEKERKRLEFVTRSRAASVARPTAMRKTVLTSNGMDADC